MCFLYLSFSMFFSFQLSIMKDEPEEAELILHDALRLAYQSGNKKAITYTYDLVTHNLSHWGRVAAGKRSYSPACQECKALGFCFHFFFLFQFLLPLGCPLGEVSIPDQKETNINICFFKNEWICIWFDIHKVYASIYCHTIVVLC